MGMQSDFKRAAEVFDASQGRFDVYLKNAILAIWGDWLVQDYGQKGAWDLLKSRGGIDIVVDMVDNLVSRGLSREAAAVEVLHKLSPSQANKRYMDLIKGMKRPY